MCIRDRENEKDKRLQKQLDFIREIDKEKEIFRQTYLADASRKENDAEHALSLIHISETGQPLHYAAQQTVLRRSVST